MSSRRSKRVTVTVVVTMALVAAVLEATQAGASVPSVGVGIGSVTSQAEYFTSVWHDPMDFSNTEDFDTTPGFLGQDGTITMNGGRLQVTGSRQIFFWPAVEGSLGLSADHDPRIRPLDASRFTHISLRMHSDRNAAGVLGFKTCLNAAGCPDGHKYFDIVKGWHTYDLDMTGLNDLETVPGGTGGVDGTPWSGNISMLYMGPGFNVPDKPSLEFDDVRIYQPTQTIPVTIGAGSGQVELWADSNANQSDDGDSTSGPGDTATLVGRYNAGTTVQVPGGILRPDSSLRFYTVQAGVRSAESAPVSMTSTSRPTPRVISPAELSGQEWSSTVRGDAWDMDQQSDASAVNANLTMSGGDANGSTAGPTVNDPGVSLNLNGHTIDTTLFRKAVVRIRYDGTWGLADAPGQGLVGRFMWHIVGAPAGQMQVGMPFVLHTRPTTYVIDLKTNPATAILDPAGITVPVGWGNGAHPYIDQLRFDPHEDPGARSWHIDFVQLLRDDRVDPTFRIRYADDTWSPGTTADIYVDNDQNPNNGLGVKITSNMPVAPGENFVDWNGVGANAGSSYIYVDEHNAAGVESGDYATGLIDVGVNGAPPTAPAVDWAAFWRFIAWLVSLRPKCTAVKRVRVNGHLVTKRVAVACPAPRKH